MDIQLSITKDLEYLIIFSLVLILPKIFQRFKIPSGITALLIGVVLVDFFPGLKVNELFRFLAQIGITSLFLFAGFEVNFEELKEDKPYLVKYLSVYSAVLALVTGALYYFLELNFSNSLILSLGLFTPSAGFIITSLHAYNVDEDQEYWVKSKAISKEIISIGFLFVALQGNNLKSMIISLLFFIVMIFGLPAIFKLFFRFVSPYAKNSEVPFLVVISLISGVLAKEIGTYYLIGAFLVGLVASRFKESIFKENEESLLNSLSYFFAVFLPFYFFYAGLGLDYRNFGLNALGVGVLMLIIFVPVRMLLINGSLKSLTGIKDYNISFSLMPTLIFGLIIANVLIERGQVDTSIIFGLLFYTFFTSLLPAIYTSFKKIKSEPVET